MRTRRCVGALVVCNGNVDANAHTIALIWQRRTMAHDGNKQSKVLMKAPISFAKCLLTRLLQWQTLSIAISPLCRRRFRQTHSSRITRFNSAEEKKAKRRQRLLLNNWRIFLCRAMLAPFCRPNSSDLVSPMRVRCYPYVLIKIGLLSCSKIHGTDSHRNRAHIGTDASAWQKLNVYKNKRWKWRKRTLHVECLSVK